MSNRSDKLISQCEGTNINEGSPDGRLVYIASPYAGDIVANTRFAIRCCLYAIRQGCTPVAPHLLYPQMLDDSEPEQRAIALKLGHSLLSVCQEVWACGSRISSGMAGEIALAETLCIPVRYFHDLSEYTGAITSENVHREGNADGAERQQESPIL